MHVWDRQKEIQVFVVLFRIRLFPCSYAETSERDQVPMSFLPGLNSGLSPLSVSVNGTLVKALLMGSCLSDWRWLWHKAGACGAKRDAETQAPLGGFLCMHGDDQFLPLQSPSTSAPSEAQRSQALWLCVRERNAWSDEWASFYLYRRFRGRWLLGGWMCRHVSEMAEMEMKR